MLNTVYAIVKHCLFNGALSGLRQFFTTGSSLEMIKNTFCFTYKALFVLKIFKFLSWLFGHGAKQLDNKRKVDFKFYDITAWLANNRNAHITHISSSKGNQTMKYGQLIECSMRNIFLEKSYRKCDRETSLRIFSQKLKSVV